jgi:hypothetical protein
MKGKTVRNRVMTAILRSYPKLSYLFARSGRKLLDEIGMTLIGLEEEIGLKAFPSGWIEQH